MTPDEARQVRERLNQLVWLSTRDLPEAEASVFRIIYAAEWLDSSNSLFDGRSPLDAPFEDVMRVLAQKIDSWGAVIAREIHDS